MRPEGAARRPVLVVGVPRSGTTWVARVLAQTDGAGYLEEPDNHFRVPYAFRVKRRLGRGEYPLVSQDESLDEYAVLWRRALAMNTRSDSWSQRARRRIGARLLASTSAAEVSAAIAGRSRVSTKLHLVERLALPEPAPPSAERLVVKSVYAPLAVEWIAARFEPRVVVVTRRPLNVLSSWRTLGWLDRTRDDMLDELEVRAQRHLADMFGVRPPNGHASPLARAAWLSGALTSSLVAAAARHPTWLLVSHERLCEQPHDRLSQLASELGLRWSDDVVRELDAMNRPGTGYEIRRVVHELPEIWRSRLTSAEIREATSVLEQFPYVE